MDPEAQAELLLVLQAQVQNLQTDAAAAADALAAAGALQDAIDAAAAANAAQAVAAGGGLVPPPAPVFTLAPAVANTAAYIDLTSTSGGKHFKGATEALNSQPFDFTDPTDLQVFLDLVLKKSQVWGWNTIFTIPDTNIATNRNLLFEFGMCPIADSVRAQVMT
jgi:hypothetical protein